MKKRRLALEYVVSSLKCIRAGERVLTLANFVVFEHLGRGRQTEHTPHQLPSHIKMGGAAERAVHPRPLLVTPTTVSWSPLEHRPQKPYPPYDERTHHC